MQIRPSAQIRNNYKEISEMCHKTGETVYLTVNGEGDLAVMAIESFIRREKMLKLREELLAVEEARQAGQKGISPADLKAELNAVIEGVKNGKYTSL